MANKSGAIRAGRAFVELFAEDSSLQRTLAVAQKRLRSWASSASSIGSKLGSFGGKLTASLAIFTKIAGDMTGDIEGLSARTGMTTDSVRAFSQQMQRLRDSVAATVVKIASALTPALQSLVNAINPVLRTFAEWARVNPAITAGLVAMPLAITAIGVALKALGVAATVTSAAIGAVAFALANPVLTAAAIGAGVIVFKALSKEADNFGRLWDGVVARVKAGDLAGAFQLLSDGIAAIWARLIAHLTEMWENYVAKIKAGFVDAKTLGGLFNQESNERQRAQIEAERVGAIKAARARADEAQGKLKSALAAPINRTPTMVAPDTDFSEPFRANQEDVTRAADAIKAIAGAVTGRASILQGRGENGILGNNAEPFGGLMDGFMNVARQVVQSAAEGVRQISSAGTFSGVAAMQQLGSQPVERQIAENTKKTADLLKKIEKNLKPAEFS